MKMVEFANSVDPDEAAHNVADVNFVICFFAALWIKT